MKNLSLAILGALSIVILAASLGQNNNTGGFLAAVGDALSVNSTNNGAGQAHPNHILVKFQPGSAANERSSLVKGIGGTEEGEINGIGVKVISVPENSRSKALEALKHNPNVQFAEEDAQGFGALVPNDPYVASQYAISMHNLSKAWDVTTGNPSIIIADIDTGVDFSHPEFAGRTVQGKDFVNNDNDPSDDHGHGTAVAGVLVATGDNGVGVAGDSWQTKLMPLKALNSSNWGYYSWWASAITYAADQGAKVINISAGGTSYSSTLQSAVNYAVNKGVVIVAAAGNAGSSSPNYPAALDNVISVSALSSGGTYTGWSSYGSAVDLSAAGEGVLTTQRGGGYASWSGTSFSSPLVAGVVALMRSANPSLSVQSVTSLLLNSTTDLGPSGWDEHYGWGKLDAGKAVAAAMGEQTSADTTNPTAKVTSPSNGATVSGTISIGYYASDNSGISKTEVLVDGQAISDQTSSSGSVTWDSSSVSDGNHSITVEAWDLVGNSAVSQAVSVSVENTVVSTPDNQAPTVSITSPNYGSTVSKSVKVSISAADDQAVASVSLYADGKLVGSSSSANATITWNASTKGRNGISKGNHTLYATATDTSGNVGTSINWVLNVQ